MCFKFCLAQRFEGVKFLRHELLLREVRVACAHFRILLPRHQGLGSETQDWSNIPTDLKLAERSKHFRRENIELILELCDDVQPRNHDGRRRSRLGDFLLCLRTGTSQAMQIGLLADKPASDKSRPARTCQSARSCSLVHLNYPSAGIWTETLASRYHFWRSSHTHPTLEMPTLPMWI